MKSSTDVDECHSEVTNHQLNETQSQGSTAGVSSETKNNNTTRLFLTTGPRTPKIPKKLTQHSSGFQ